MEGNGQAKKIADAKPGVQVKPVVSTGGGGSDETDE